jgi:hypothetical protein
MRGSNLDSARTRLAGSRRSAFCPSLETTADTENMDNELAYKSRGPNEWAQQSFAVGVDHDRLVPSTTLYPILPRFGHSFLREERCTALEDKDKYGLARAIPVVLGSHSIY